MNTLRLLALPVAAACSLLVAPAQAEILVANTGPYQFGSGNRAFATSWTQLADFSDVSISATLFGVGEPGVEATAWLTRSIGLGATDADLIASTDITSDLLFEGLDLAADTYYLVVMFQSGSIAAGWRGNDGASMVTAPDVLLGASYVGPFLSFPSYGPSADFIELSGQYMYSVDGLRVAAVPEPGTLGLLASGLTGLVVARRRRAQVPQKV